MSEDTALKLALVEEYRVALRYRNLYHDLSESFLRLLKEVVEMRDRDELSKEEQARLHRLMVEADRLLSPNLQRPDGINHSDDKKEVWEVDLI